MLWIVYSLLCAFFFATSDALTKKALSSKNEYHVLWLRLLFSLPILVASVLVTGIPPLDAVFIYSVIIALPLEIVAAVLYVKALKKSPLGLTVPLLGLTPIFLILTSLIILGEKITVMGGVGIFLISAGGYSLNLHDAKTGLLGPVRALLKEDGSRLMLLV
ncbi:MAG: DMT family transporter, partial [Nitrospirae bacterium]|nr:DMT family transporter [Nitrospirota bacterium]